MSRNIAKILSAAAVCILLLGCGNDGGESAVTDSSTEIPTSIEIVPTPTPAGDVDNANLSVKPLVTIPIDKPLAAPPLPNLVGVRDLVARGYVIPGGVSQKGGW